MFPSSSCLRICDRREPFLLQLFDRLLVLPQIEFRPHEDYGHVGTVVPHLWVPFGTDVLKGGGIHQREAYQEDILEGDVLKLEIIDTLKHG